MAKKLNVKCTWRAKAAAGERFGSCVVKDPLATMFLDSKWGNKGEYMCKTINKMSDHMASLPIKAKTLDEARRSCVRFAKTQTVPQ